MRFSTFFGAIVLASAILASPHVARNNDDHDDDHDDDHIRIFKNANERW